MDFEEIDRVIGDTLSTGDIINDEDLALGDWHQVRGVDDSDSGMVILTTYNLSTGDEDEVPVDPDRTYSIFRSY